MQPDELLRALVTDSPAAGLGEIAGELTRLWVRARAGEPLSQAETLLVFGALQTVLLNFASVQARSAALAHAPTEARHANR